MRSASTRTATSSGSSPTPQACAGRFRAVAASERYIFYAHTCGLENQPEVRAGEAPREKPICYFGVSRYTRDGKHAPFPGGQTRFKNMVAFREAHDNHGLIPRGVAATDKVLFVADTAFDRIKVINPETMKISREFPAPRPSRLAIDPSGDVWAICGGGKCVASYSPDGKLRLEALPLPAGAVPEGLGFDREGRLLVVCDATARVSNQSTPSTSGKDAAEAHGVPRRRGRHVRGPRARQGRPVAVRRPDRRGL